MKTIQAKSYGGEIRETRDGEFQVFFLYNMGKSTDGFSSGDVYERKTYKTEKMAEKKVNEYISKQLN